MRELDVTKIRDAVCTMVQEVNYDLPADVLCAIKCAKGCERNERAAYILDKIEENIRIAGEEHIPLCQDTGLACVFLEVGQEVMLTGGYLYDAVNEGVRRGYTEGYLRKSVVADPLRRVNTKDNTPARIHVDIVPGDKVKVTVAPKGFGSENMSRIAMFPPSENPIICAVSIPCAFMKPCRSSANCRIVKGASPLGVFPCPRVSNAYTWKCWANTSICPTK